MAVKGKVNKVEEPSSNWLIRNIRGLKSEIKRITWASKEDTKKATKAVIGFCVVTIILITVMDYGLNNLYRVIFK